MITFETKYLRYSIDEAGNNVEFTDKSTSNMAQIMKDMGLLDGTYQGKGAEFA